jgi:thymidylate synthase (FAD)
MFYQSANSCESGIETESAALWTMTMVNAEKSYLELLRLGWTPQQARSVLPNSLKTEIVVTANLREWRLIFKQRAAKTAHPQMRELMCPLLRDVILSLPEVFDDMQSLTNNDKEK